MNVTEMEANVMGMICALQKEDLLHENVSNQVNCTLYSYLAIG